MQPGHIRVFDGLRITTEHIEHFQGSLHSAITDVRSILGLGRVHRGFDVQKAGGDAVAVQPGLAFDYVGNRIVNDEPKTLAVPYVSEQTPGYVCIAYAQLENGVVDGQATLVWDSCEVSVRTAPPKLGENVLAIATLVPATGNGERFKVVPSVAPRDRGEARTDGARGNEAHAGDTAAAGTPPAAEDVGTPVTPAVVPAPASPTTSPSPVLRVRQNVTRLRGDDASRTALATTLRNALRLAVPQDGAVATAAATLASAVIRTGFPITSLSCHAVLSAAVTVPGDATQPATEASCSSTSHGEATLGDGAVMQSCITDARAKDGATGGPAHVYTPGVSDGAIARLPFARSYTADESSNAIIPADVLTGLMLSLEVGQPTTDGFTLDCRVRWAGPQATQDVTDWLGEHGPGLDWTAEILWKAIGLAPARTEGAATPQP
jgi:hypothetical protein